MGLFSKKEAPAASDASAPGRRTGSTAAPEPDASDPSQGRPRGKTGPTPTRREAEAARKARLNPTLSKKERRRRQADQERRERMAQMERRDSDPGRTLMRDHVDSRFRLGEIVMPLLLVTLAASLLAGANPQLASLVMLVFYAIIVAVIIELFLMWRGFTRLLEERHPGYPRKGLFLYGMNRTLQIRRWRMPKPRVERGEKI